ncbi:lipoyl(octanoyl) transferase LipB [Paraburkholderia bannensis]|uniref:lipoyl(octanoyl) transferase LipB n=1 Tax=Paraburkholderia bannensis TaxID=765414 RepID=UPI002AB7E191|nr:lipoyl(octanoyl) transferase LipB [Paraburkholderia bannensis]
MCATPVSSPSIHSDPVLERSVDPVDSADVAEALVLRWRGTEDYQTSFDAMREFTAQRDANTPDEIWLVEHPGVFTLGQAGKPEHLLIANSGIPLVQIDRGGQITYHGPGQVVAYLLLDLRRRKLMVRELVTLIEQAVIETLAAYNLAGVRKDGAPGIYVPDDAQGDSAVHRGAKVAALGLKIRNGCSYHGVSLNVSMDLSPFLAINPCGYAGLETVDMATLGARATWREAAQTLAARLEANLAEHAATQAAKHSESAQVEANAAQAAQAAQQAEPLPAAEAAVADPAAEAAAVDPAARAV